ncbi:MAG: hypothetical protein QOI87_1678 [Bradyrhizobium sp.]|nr:hypothetical protein [Bradyrhizobium sp.]
MVVIYSRQAPACTGHPPLSEVKVKKDVDGRDQPGHDGEKRIDDDEEHSDTCGAG